jgi:hypothetical protein
MRVREAPACGVSLRVQNTAAATPTTIAPTTAFWGVVLAPNFGAAPGLVEQVANRPGFNAFCDEGLADAAGENEDERAVLDFLVGAHEIDQRRAARQAARNVGELRREANGGKMRDGAGGVRLAA